MYLCVVTLPWLFTYFPMWAWTHCVLPQVLHDWFRSVDLEAAGGKPYSLAPAGVPGAQPLAADAGHLGLEAAGLANAMLAAKWA
jgi:hypothetical protein